MGSTFSHTANTSNSKRASQKTGVLDMRREYPLMIRSAQVPRKTPARMPRTSPRIPEMSQANTIRNSEFDSFTPITCDTGCR